MQRWRRSCRRENSHLILNWGISRMWGQMIFQGWGRIFKIWKMSFLSYLFRRGAINQMRRSLLRMGRCSWGVWGIARRLETYKRSFRFKDRPIRNWRRLIYNHKCSRSRLKTSANLWNKNFRSWHRSISSVNRIWGTCRKQRGKSGKCQCDRDSLRMI